MRRLIIFLYWLFKDRHHVSLPELIRFMFKPTVKRIASRYLKEITATDLYYKVTFMPHAGTLFWPLRYPIDGIYQVTSETFDEKDWHYYQKEHTEVVPGEVLLDIGAAEGLFSLTVVDRCEQVILIEPNDHFVTALERTFESYKNKVTIHNVAAGSENATILFNSDSLVSRVTSTKSAGDKKTLIKIDDLLGSTPVTYLKADLEGFESAMLRGAEKTIKRNKPKIAITAYHIENKTQEIIDIIKTFVPEYKHYTKGISQTEGKPVMIHFWIPK